MFDRKWKLIVDYTDDRCAPQMYSYYTYVGLRIKLWRLKPGWTSCFVMEHCDGLWIMHNGFVKEEYESD